MPVGLIVGALAAGTGVRVAVAILLIAAYAAYTIRTIKAGGDAEGEEELQPLFFDRSKQDPPNTTQIATQSSSRSARSSSGPSCSSAASRRSPRSSASRR